MRLSPSTLGDFARCSRCWWLDRQHGIKWPRGIFPSLPGGMDRILKPWYDLHRTSGTLPPELVGRVPGLLYRDQDRINRWRNWRSGLVADLGNGVELSGAIDELLYDPETKLYGVLDAKTRGAPPKKGDTERYYGTQASCYDAMLRANNMPTTGQAAFAYYWPVSATGGAPFGFEFGTEVVVIKTDPAGAEALARDAVKCLAGPLPEPSPTCEQCAYIKERGLYMASRSATVKESVAQAAAPSKQPPAPVAQG